MADETEQPAAPAPPPPAAPPAPPAKTTDEILQDPLVAAPAARVRDAIVSAKEFANEITLVVQRERIRDVAQSFKDDGFTYLVDATGVDYSKYPNHTGDRFAVVYHLYSFAKNDRVRLKVFVPADATVPTVSTVWKTANWHERETFDMFGIRFEGHPNLERILMWEGFNGHPLRKDFPIRGIDTGARIYPEIFPEGGGPKPGSTGKDAKDVNLWKGPWTDYGRAPVGPPPAAKPAPKPIAAAAPAPAPAAAAVEGEGEEE